MGSLFLLTHTSCHFLPLLQRARGMAALYGQKILVRGNTSRYVVSELRFLRNRWYGVNLQFDESGEDLKFASPCIIIQFK